MDGSTAVGLAANVLQFVQFICNLYPLADDIKKNTDGLTLNHANLDAIPTDLQKHSLAVSVCGDSPHLKRLVGDLQSAASDLKDAITKIKRKRGTLFKLIDIIEALARLPNFKICVSSRPWNQFKHTIGLSSVDSMQLHLFTREDIENFARDSISNHLIYRKAHAHRLEYEDLIKGIGQRAEGVFLWVRLVVRSLRDGLMNDDPVSLMSYLQTWKSFFGICWNQSTLSIVSGWRGHSCLRLPLRSP